MDNGAERRRIQQKIRVTVMAPPSASSSVPRFVERGLRERITESDRPGQLIVLLSADDADGRDSLFFAIEGELGGEQWRRRVGLGVDEYDNRCQWRMWKRKREGLGVDEHDNRCQWRKRKREGLGVDEHDNRCQWKMRKRKREGLVVDEHDNRCQWRMKKRKREGLGVDKHDHIDASIRWE